MTSSPNNSLSTFKNFDTFHFFYFSRKEDKTYLLLSSKQSQCFSHITGSVNQYDPGIFFTAGRKVIDISYGLLAPQNLEYFKEGSMFPIVSKDMLQLCKPNLQTPALMNSKVYQRFIEETFERMLPFQDETNNAYFFVEIPYIETNKFNQFCNENSFDLQINYFEIQSVLQKSDNISEETHSIFEQPLRSYVEKYIENAEPIPISARYGVICIYTTPTNYRTMGILGSCFKKHGEEWKFYRYPLEEPTEDELCMFDGIFLPGASVCAADKSLPWRENLLDLIRKAYNSSKCRILGTCFGIQILAEAFQGKSARMADYERGSSQLEISRDFWELPYVKGLGFEPKSRLLLPKSHFDSVIKPPPMGTVHAYKSSNCTDVEIMTMGDRCLAFQGHPEMNEAWTACLLYQTMKEKMNFKVYYEEIKKKYFSDKFEHEMWLKVIYSFFKGEH